jgi:hypothetical protein
LGRWAEVGLEKLGFCFGDDLNTVTAEEYAEAGFKQLEWRRVLNTYRKLKQNTITEHFDSLLSLTLL